MKRTTGGIGLTAFTLWLSTLAAAAEPLAVFEIRERLGIDWPRTLVTYELMAQGGRMTVEGGPSVRLSRPATPGALSLVNADTGDETPFQLWQINQADDGSMAAARISFYTDLQAGGTVRYELSERAGGSTDYELAPPTVVSNDNGLLLENGLTGIRLPAAGEQRFTPPLRMNIESLHHTVAESIDAGFVPGPIQGIRLLDGSWVGGSAFAADTPDTAPGCRAMRCTLVEKGPLFAEAVVDYEFEDDRFYRLRVRVLAEDPAIRVDEQFDFDLVGNPTQWRLEVSLGADPRGDDWRPDRAIWWLPNSGTQRSPVTQRLLDLGYAFPSAGGPRVEAPLGAQAFDYPGNGERRLTGLTVWPPWGSSPAHYVALAAGDEIEAAAKAGGVLPPEQPEPPDALIPGAEQGDASGLIDEPPDIPPIRMLAIVPMHAGSWRGAHFDERHIGLFTTSEQNLRLRLPLGVEPHPQRIIHTGEYDPDLPFSQGRRRWALIGGPLWFHDKLVFFRAHDGFVNLDTYKDWILDWTEDVTVTYPRLLFGPEEVVRRRDNLDSHPAAETLRDYLEFTSDEARRNRLLRQLTGQGLWASPGGQVVHALRDWSGGGEFWVWNSHYRQSQMARWIHDADELLGADGLTEEQRRDVRGRIAAMCHLMADAHFNPRGSMVHLGNPNMPINRTLALGLAAPLIPDHPLAESWLDAIANYTAHKLAVNTAPGGAWSELITYYEASAPHLMQAAAVLDRSGRLDDATAALAIAAARFPYRLLTPPDPRFGVRTVPGWGHEGIELQSHWLVAAVLAMQRDPEAAASLIWAWEQLGRPMSGHHDVNFSQRAILYADELLAEQDANVPDSFGSAFLPGFGAVLRAHPGTPGETYLSYRRGYMVSHSDANQGDFVFYAKGVPFSSTAIGGYALHGNKPAAELYRSFGWHNQVRFGRRDAVEGWPGGGSVSAVHAHAFSDSADYLRGVGDYGPQRHHRRLVMVKGRTPDEPTYVIMHDDMPLRDSGAGENRPTWWSLRTPGAAAQVQPAPDGFRYTSPWGPLLDVRFAGDHPLPPLETRDADVEGSLLEDKARRWREAGSPTSRDHRDGHLIAEETVSVTSVGPFASGQPITAVLYPRNPGDVDSRIRQVAPGVTRITTTVGTDWLFLSHEPISFDNGEVRFSGHAGAVRVFETEAHLLVFEGPGEVGYRGATLQAAQPAMERIALDETARTQRIDRPAPGHDIAFALDPAAGPIEEIAPGIRFQAGANGDRSYAFEFAEPTAIGGSAALAEPHADAFFIGRRGGIAITGTDEQTIRLVLLDGTAIGYGPNRIAEAPPPYEATYGPDSLRIQSAAPNGGYMLAIKPASINRLPVMLWNNQTWAPGTSGDRLMIVLHPGPQIYEIRNLEQPPIFRDWRHW